MRRNISTKRNSALGGPAKEYLIKTECANCKNISEKEITKEEAAKYTPLVNNLP